ncbi:conserved hypothetical protein [Magnetospirillum sp. LM-5]|nr:conserved hypothetical protein [Magnetospirillum sp. LM-5]
MSLGESSDGSIRIDDERSFEIFLPLHTSRERDRFTTAHELGHLFLHYLYPRKMGRKVKLMKARRAGSGLVEWEANWFAAAFLMPRQTFVRVHDECGGNLHELCEEFGVSLAAARIRAETVIGPHVEVEA